MARDGFISPSEEEGAQAKVDKKAPEFGIEDLIAEIGKQLSASEDALTTRELCERALGLPPTAANIATTSRIVHDMVITGQIKFAGKKRIANTTGGMQAIPAWTLVKKENDDKS